MANGVFSLKERIREAKELGYGYGINNLEFPNDFRKVLKSILYNIAEKRPASNVYLIAVFENAYNEGKKDSDNIVSISPKDRPRFDMSILRKAFEIGREWRRKSKDMAFIYDERLGEFMEQIPEEAERNWKWIEKTDMAILDSWMAGFRYEGEDVYGDVYIPRDRFIIACDRMRKMKAMYEQGDDPGDEDEHQKVFAYFLKAAEKLEKIGRADLIECLACPEPYNGLGRYSDERSFKYGCKKDCRESCRLIDGMCEKERKALKDYYIVMDDDYWPLEEDRYPDWP